MRPAKWHTLNWSKCLDLRMVVNWYFRWTWSEIEISGYADVWSVEIGIVVIWWISTAEIPWTANGPLPSIIDSSFLIFSWHEIGWSNFVMINYVLGCSSQSKIHLSSSTENALGISSQLPGLGPYFWYFAFCCHSSRGALFTVHPNPFDRARSPGKWFHYFFPVGFVLRFPLLAAELFYMHSIFLVQFSHPCAFFLTLIWVLLGVSDIGFRDCLFIALFVIVPLFKYELSIFGLIVPKGQAWSDPLAYVFSSPVR